MSFKQTFEDIFKKLQKNRNAFKDDLKIARKYYKMFFNPRTKSEKTKLLTF